MDPTGIPAGIRMPQPKLKVQPARKQIFVPAPGKVQMTRTVAIGASPDQELLQSLYEAILIADRDGQILDGNGRAETLFGLSAAELRLRRLNQLIAKMDEPVLAGLRRTADEQRYTVIEAACQGPGGSIFQAEIAASGIQWRETPGLCLSIRDITRRKEMEAALVIVNNAMYNTVDGIVITTVEGMIQFANPAFAELLGQESRAEVVGRDIRSFVADGPLFDEMLRLVRERNRCAQELMLKGASGPVPVLASGAPTIEPPDRLTGMVFSYDECLLHLPR
jgi:PAS domain S-box-containing protein